MTSKTLSTNVTTLDLIKTFAVICMIIDHIGFYFFPDASWFRVVGRLGGAPIWFFLIGFATSRTIPNSWLIGALILAVSDYVLMGSVFSINVLLTLVLLRLIIDHAINITMRSRYLFWLSMPILALFYIPTNAVMEYGTLGVICGILGYSVRHYDRLYAVSFFTKYDFYGLVAFSIVSNVILQSAVMGFNALQASVLLTCISFITLILINLKVEDVPEIKNESVKKLLQFGGRKTLEIYVTHLVIFKIIFVFLYSVGFYR